MCGSLAPYRPGSELYRFSPPSQARAPHCMMNSMRSPAQRFLSNFLKRFWRLDLNLMIALAPRICGQGRTALHCCADITQDGPPSSSLLEAAELLIRNGADVNAADNNVSCRPKAQMSHAAWPVRGRLLAPT